MTRIWRKENDPEQVFSGSIPRFYQPPRSRTRKRRSRQALLADQKTFRLTYFFNTHRIHQQLAPWDQTGVPGEVGFAHFHCSTISGLPRERLGALSRASSRASPKFLDPRVDDCRGFHRGAA
jgi:hypothetical protein